MLCIYIKRILVEFIKIDKNSKSEVMKKFVLMIIPALIFISCNSKVASEEEVRPIKEGVYSGTINVEYFGDMPPKSWWRGGSGKITLELENGKFTCKYSNEIPGGGSGNYLINANKITFNDENMWLANFDGGLILTGEYNFSFDGIKLKFSKIYNGYAHYKYELKRQ